ncbi:MAG: TonB-dependent receptor plug domain-containing protein, partial [Myxococcota bacterium]
DAPSGFEGDAYERVVVTASRYGQAPLDSPSTLSVLTADDVRMSGATDVTDLLRRVVGVDVMSMASGQPEISIRGFNRELNNKVLVLIDGRSVYWDFIGTTQWDSFPVVLEEIERIEVIRGPGSAVYGANAVTGVVNIITKTPGETPETLGTLSVGSPGFVRGAAMTSGRSGDTAYRLSAGYRQHGRWAKLEEATGEGSFTPFFEDQDRGSQSVRAHGRLDRRLGKESFLSLSGGYVDGRAEIYNIGALGNFARDTTNTFVRADGTFGPVHARVFWNRVSGRTGPWLASPADARILNAEFVAQTIDAEVEGFGTFETGPVQHRVNGGVGYRRKGIDNFQYLDSDNIDEDHLNAFINEEAVFGALRVVGSLRADRHPLISLDKTLSPRLAAIVRVDEKRAVRVSGGTAFRVPTLVESYMDTVIPTDVDGIVIRDVGSRSLVPERIITVEAGYHDESTLYHQADVAVYYNRVSQLIGLSPVSPVVEGLDPSGAFVAGQTGWVNLPERYHGFGIEADGKLYPTDGLDVFANIAVQALLRQAPGEDLVQDKTPSLVKANVGVQYRSPYRVDVSAAAHVVSSQTWSLRQFDEAGQIRNVDGPIPLRALVTARVAVRPFADEELELSVVGWNLAAFLVEAAREHPEGQLLQPRAFGSVSYRF